MIMLVVVEPDLTPWTDTIFTSTQVCAHEIPDGCRRPYCSAPFCKTADSLPVLSSVERFLE
jgi:hypothetical protein